MSNDDGLTTFLEELERLGRAIYRRGYESGGIDMRNNILHAAGAPMVFRPGTASVVTGSGTLLTTPPPPLKEARPLGRRAPRGLTQSFIRKELSRRPGQTPAELEKTAAAYEPEILGKTIGNTLRRLEAKLYERSPDGRRWFLKGQQQSAEESSKTASADHFNFEPEGR
jgi:hypothetical protein